MDLNYIYQLLQNGSQSKLIDYINFKEFEKEIAFNPTAQNAINILLEQMSIGEIESEKNIKEWLEDIYLMKYDKNVAKHKEKRVYPTYIDFEKVIVCLVKIESDPDKRKGYALIYPQNTICKAILVEEENIDRNTNNIVKFNPVFSKIENIANEELPISIKKRMKKTILEKLASQKISSYRRTTIAMLYEMTIIVSVDYKESLFKECLKELKKKNKVYFGNIGDIYSEISLV
jgi:hypothetical protein